MDADNTLSQQEFIVAMHLITKRVNGEEIPDTVPSSLVASASSTKKKKESHTPLAGDILQPALVLSPTTTTSSPPSLVGSLDLNSGSGSSTPIDSTTPRTTSSTVSASTLATYGVSEKLEEYDCIADLANLAAMTDFAALQQLQAKLPEEIRALKLKIEKQVCAIGVFEF